MLAGALSDLESRLSETGGRVELGPSSVVLGDAAQLRQLFQNLIGNALKFHQRGLAPHVVVSTEVVAAGPASSGRARVAESAGISVTDNGIGFDEKYLESVFTIFQRLHGRDEYEGTGIGLAICRKVAERHGGTITARSKPGQGATFIVTLPLFHA